MALDVSYLEKLKDPRWQKKRLEILQRDGWACVVCNRTDKNLQVHHNWYVKGASPWEYSSSQLCTLCQACHEKATEIQDNLKEYLSKMKPSQQAALLHRSERYCDKERDYRGVTISATREDSEPHRLARLRAFLERMKKVDPDSLFCLLAVHDHKGCLEATWSLMALESSMKIAETVWGSFGEHEVKNFLIDEYRTVQSDGFTGIEVPEVDF
jgi:hypothetical protein